MQVDFAQNLSDLLALWLFPDIGHRLAVGVGSVCDLKCFPSATAGRLLYLSDDSIEGVMIVVEENHHPWVVKPGRSVVGWSNVRLDRHEPPLLWSYNWHMVAGGFPKVNPPSQSFPMSHFP